MNPFALILAASLSAVSGDDVISVHEWGVVVYDGGEAVIAKGSSGGPWYDPMETVCFAPVLYFYGPDFAGEVTVFALGGIFNVWPSPDRTSTDFVLRGLGSSICWSVSASSDDSETRLASVSEISSIPGFDWAAGYWRTPRSLMLSRESDSFRDSFLYYEVDLSGTGFPLTLPGFAPEGTSEEDLVAGNVLLFRRLASGGVALSSPSSDSIDFFAAEAGGRFED